MVFFSIRRLTNRFLGGGGKRRKRRERRRSEWGEEGGGAVRVQKVVGWINNPQRVNEYHPLFFTAVWDQMLCPAVPPPPSRLAFPCLNFRFGDAFLIFFLFISGSGGIASFFLRISTMVWKKFLRIDPSETFLYPSPSSTPPFPENPNPKLSHKTVWIFNNEEHWNESDDHESSRRGLVPNQNERNAITTEISIPSIIIFTINEASSNKNFLR